MAVQLSGRYIPIAAVFNVPNGRLRSDIGSHTSISPSRMMLEWALSDTKQSHRVGYLLVHPWVESCINERGEATHADVFPIEICIILSLPRPKLSGMCDNGKCGIP